MYIAAAQGRKTSRGQNFYVNRNLLSLQSFATRFKNIYIKSKMISNDQELIQSDPTFCPQNHKGNNRIHKFEIWFYIHFFHIPRGRGWQPLGDKILMSTGTSCHFGHLLQVSKKSLWSLILTFVFFFMILYIYIASGKGLGDKVLMSTETSHHFILLLQVKKKSLKFDFCNILNDLIHVCSPIKAGADSNQGTKFWCQQKCLVTSFICCKFQNISLKSDFIHFFHGLLHVYIPGAEADSPQGTTFWCQQKGLITLPICYN